MIDRKQTILQDTNRTCLFNKKFPMLGEDDDVFPHRKPHLGIYEVALAKAGLKLPLDENECWVHIGDDLANDVGASFELGALTVHVKIIHDERPNSIFYSTAPESEQEERRKND